MTARACQPAGANIHTHTQISVDEGKGTWPTEQNIQSKSVEDGARWGTRLAGGKHALGIPKATKRVHLSREDVVEAELR